MSKRDEYVGKMHAKLEEWNTEIDELSAKADKVKGDVKNEYIAQIEALKVKRADAGQKIEEFQRAGESALKDLKSGIDKAWKSMGKAIDSAKSRFHSTVIPKEESMEKQSKKIKKSGKCGSGESCTTTKEDIMKSSTRDKAEGTFHELKGKAKEIVGKLTDNPKLKVEGSVEKAAGKVQTKVGQVKKVFGK